ncbi:hypothetical protein DL766_005727 [Monosporascus sp. MC13-8B]|uniref:Matrin-type domain-containing protein n=1 Tax=Monosporascus cannonballus TaxID=155416 RepID=A0ABY0H5P7_9PEZI|nr:hypothetical protein DL762_005158 [Monosporascus cannonballus]RYO97196.1 hypothetical protein DL763_002857 [Monosporascus cannonballus]RYP28711.1 hypothetical protein DL766_005727 [Monosporascus sp. MC13-8B]
MDYQNRAGSKFGGGGVASHSATNADRRERLRKLALETIDLDKDPYFFKNHVGSFECRLCLTVHQNDGSYLAHTQGKKHQTNLARRAAREQKEGKGQQIDPNTGLPVGVVGAGFGAVGVKKNVVKIGRPGYKITKVRDGVTRQQGLLFQLQYPEIAQGVVPKVRFMSAFEQRVDDPPDKNFQYMLVAAEPYETCGFKLQAREIDRSEDRYWTWWDADLKEFWVQVMFLTEREERYVGLRTQRATAEQALDVGDRGPLPLRPRHLVVIVEAERRVVEGDIEQEDARRQLRVLGAVGVDRLDDARAAGVLDGEGGRARRAAPVAPEEERGHREPCVVAPEEDGRVPEHPVA